MLLDDLDSRSILKEKKERENVEEKLVNDSEFLSEVFFTIFIPTRSHLFIHFSNAPIHFPNPNPVEDTQIGDHDFASHRTNL